MISPEEDQQEEPPNLQSPIESKSSDKDDQLEQSNLQDRQDDQVHQQEEQKIAYGEEQEEGLEQQDEEQEEVYEVNEDNSIQDDEQLEELLGQRQTTGEQLQDQVEFDQIQKEMPGPQEGKQPVAMEKEIKQYQQQEPLDKPPILKDKPAPLLIAWKNIEKLMGEGIKQSYLSAVDNLKKIPSPPNIGQECYSDLNNFVKKPTVFFDKSKRRVAKKRISILDSDSDHDQPKITISSSSPKINEPPKEHVNEKSEPENPSQTLNPILNIQTQIYSKMQTTLSNLVENFMSKPSVKLDKTRRRVPKKNAFLLNSDVDSNEDQLANPDTNLPPHEYPLETPFDNMPPPVPGNDQYQDGLLQYNEQPPYYQWDEQQQQYGDEQCWDGSFEYNHQMPNSYQEVQDQDGEQDDHDQMIHQQHAYSTIEDYQVEAEDLKDQQEDSSRSGRREESSQRSKGEKVCDTESIDHSERHDRRSEDVVQFEQQTYSILADLLKTIAEDEIEINDLRKQLALLPDFNARALFDHMDVVTWDQELDKEEIHKFLSDNRIEDISTNECELVMIQYDADRDGSIQFDEFLNMFIPTSNQDLKTAYVNKDCLREYKYEDSLKISPRVVNQVIQILEKEVELQRKIQQQLSILMKELHFELSCRTTFAYLSEGKDYICQDDMQAFLDKQGHQLSDDAIKALFHRCDFNLDQVIEYSEYCALIGAHQSQQRIIKQMRQDEKSSQEYDDSSLDMESGQDYGGETSNSEIVENNLQDTQEMKMEEFQQDQREEYEEMMYEWADGMDQVENIDQFIMHNQDVITGQSFEEEREVKQAKETEEEEIILDEEPLYDEQDQEQRSLEHQKSQRSSILNQSQPSKQLEGDEEEQQSCGDYKEDIDIQIEETDQFFQNDIEDSAEIDELQNENIEVNPNLISEQVQDIIQVAATEAMMISKSIIASDQTIRSIQESRASMKENNNSSSAALQINSSCNNIYELEQRRQVIENMSPLIGRDIMDYQSTGNSINQQDQYNIEEDIGEGSTNRYNNTQQQMIHQEQDSQQLMNNFLQQPIIKDENSQSETKSRNSKKSRGKYKRYLSDGVEASDKQHSKYNNSKSSQQIDDSFQDGHNHEEASESQSQINELNQDLQEDRLSQAQIQQGKDNYEMLQQLDAERSKMHTQAQSQLIPNFNQRLQEQENLIINEESVEETKDEEHSGPAKNSNQIISAGFEQDPNGGVEIVDERIIDLRTKIAHTFAQLDNQMQMEDPQALHAGMFYHTSSQDQASTKQQILSSLGNSPSHYTGQLDLKHQYSSSEAQTPQVNILDPRVAQDNQSQIPGGPIEIDTKNGSSENGYRQLSYAQLSQLNRRIERLPMTSTERQLLEIQRFKLKREENLRKKRQEDELKQQEEEKYLVENQFNKSKKIFNKNEFDDRYNEMIEKEKKKKEERLNKQKELEKQDVRKPAINKNSAKMAQEKKIKDREKFKRYFSGKTGAALKNIKQDDIAGSGTIKGQDQSKFSNENLQKTQQIKKQVLNQNEKSLGYIKDIDQKIYSKQNPVNQKQDGNKQQKESGTENGFRNLSQRSIRTRGGLQFVVESPPHEDNHQQNRSPNQIQLTLTSKLYQQISTNDIMNTPTIPNHRNTPPKVINPQLLKLSSGKNNEITPVIHKQAPSLSINDTSSISNRTPITSQIMNAAKTNKHQIPSEFAGVKSKFKGQIQKHAKQDQIEGLQNSLINSRAADLSEALKVMSDKQATEFKKLANKPSQQLNKNDFNAGGKSARVVPRPATSHGLGPDAFGVIASARLVSGGVSSPGGDNLALKGSLSRYQKQFSSKKKR